MQFVGEPVLSADGQQLPFSQVATIGDFVFVSGQVPLVGGQLKGADIVEQTNCVIDNIEAQLALAGLRLGDVVKATAWLTTAKDFAGYNRVYAERFGTHRPVRSTVVSELMLPGALVEIEAMAIRSAS